MVQTNKQTVSLSHIWELTDLLTEAYRRKDGNEVLPETLLPLLNLQPESDLQREIRDIISELEIIKFLMRQQKEVIFKFVANAREILSRETEDESGGKADQMEAALLRALGAVARKLNPDVPKDDVTNATLAQPAPNGKSVCAARYKAFDKRATELDADISSYMEELEELTRAADGAADSVGSSEDPMKATR